MEQQDPQSSLERELVERLAGILWRLRRVPFFEAAIMEARHHQAGEIQMGAVYSASAETEQDKEEADWHAALHFINDAGWSDALGKLARHEAILVNALTKTLLLLEEYRSTQREPVMLEAVTLPAAA